MSEPLQQGSIGPDNNPAMGSPDLINCDREPIHIPGAIQPHGVLLALNPSDLRVVQVGGDTERCLGAPIAALLGSSLTNWLSAEHVTRLRDMMGSGDQIGRPAHAFNFQHANSQQTFEVTAHLSTGLLILEIEQHDLRQTADFLTVVQDMIRKIQPAASVDASLNLIVENVREVSGFDRVMVYCFLPDGTGVVKAEARRPDLTPYLGLHYPASDIPKQARELYVRNWIRLIPDVHYEPAPLIGANSAGIAPIDLSYCMLRSVSPVHLEYLTNMGVAASMSLSIIIGNRLWGLIACHHQQPRYLPHRLRVALELFSQMTSFLLETKIAGVELAARLERKSIHETLVSRLTGESDLAKELTQSHPNLIDYVPSSGVGVWLDGRFLAVGRTPEHSDVVQLVAWLNETVADGIFETNCLSSVYPPATAFAETASGLLALSISKTPRDYVLWFRPEFVREVNWAGNPEEKPLKLQDEGPRLSPRKSFSLWKKLGPVSV